MKTINIAYLRSESKNPVVLERQKNQVIDFAITFGIDKDDILIIQDISTSNKRIGFKTLMAIIEDMKPLNVTAINLFVYDLDRLSRNEETLMKLLSIENLHIKIVTMPEFNKDIAPIVLPFIMYMKKESNRKNSYRVNREEGN